MPVEARGGRGEALEAAERRAKRRTGREPGSRALGADAAETKACAALSPTLLLGLAASAWPGWWWADPMAARVMVPFILREAREAWEGEECVHCTDRGHPRSLETW